MKKKSPQILVINTGSTTTKIGFFEGEKELWQQKFDHSTHELADLENFDQQVAFRKRLIKNFLNQKNIDIKKIDLFMCRGGLINPVQSGVYQVNEKMLSDLKNAPKQHASNLSAVIGYHLSQNKRNVFIADPVVVDEMQDLARYAGHRLFERKSIFHALNHKATARRFAKEKGQNYEDLNLIVAHLGGGISVGAHQHGLVIDVNQALDGEGPFSPERSGSLPVGDLLKKAFSGKYSYPEMAEMIVGKGGLVSYLGTNNVKKIVENLTPEKQEVLAAMAYQVAKTIGEMATVLKGDVQAIILTGGLAHNRLITDEITKRVSFIAPVKIYPGEDELKALAYNGWLVYNGELKPKTYQ